MVDISRGTAGVYLPPDVSNEIWQQTQEQSAVMKLARKIALPGRGVDIPIITGDPEAQWVNETDEKPVSRGSLDNKIMRGYTMSVIVPFSNQFKRDMPALYQALVGRLPGVLAARFDATVFFGTAAPGSDFDVMTGVPAVSVANVPANADGSGGQTAYDGFLAALASVATAGGNLSGWALSPNGEVMALSAKDGSGRPLFTTDLQTEGAIGQILGRRVYPSRAVYQPGTPETVGFGGDWSAAIWGQVEGVQISISDQATLTDVDNTTNPPTPQTLNLWQRNMFAVRAEIEVGFRLRDPNQFVRLTGNNTPAATPAATPATG